MKTRLSALYPSLVGSFVEYKVSGSSVMDSINPLRTKIEKELTMCRHNKRIETIIMAAELYYFYLKQPYYMAVRGSIDLGRLRPVILEYLESSHKERFDCLLGLLKKSSPKDPLRDVKLIAIGYFVKTYPRVLRSPELKELLSREEFINIS